MGSMKIKNDYSAPEISSEKDYGYFPTITLGNDVSNAMKDCEVGEECELTMKGVVKSISKTEGNGVRVEFEARECEYMDEDEEDDDDKETYKKVAKMAMKKSVA